MCDFQSRQLHLSRIQCLQGAKGRRRAPPFCSLTTMDLSAGDRGLRAVLVEHRRELLGDVFRELVLDLMTLHHIK